MKKTFLFTLLFYTCALFSQEKLHFEKVITVDSSISKDKLYDRVSNKLITLYGGNFKFERDVLLSDKSQGLIKLKLSKPYNEGKAFSNDSGVIDFTITFLFKNGKSKIDLNDFRHTGNTSFGLILDTDTYPYNDHKMFKKTMDKNWLKLINYLDIYKDELLSIGENIIKTPAETESNW